MDLTNGNLQIEAESTAHDSADTAATEVVDTGSPEGQDDQEQEAQQEKTFTQAELDAKVSKRLAVERRRWERDQAERESAPKPKPQPKPEDFATPGEFINAAAEWKADQIVAQREQEAQQRTVQNTYQEREEAAREKYADFDIAHKQPHEGGPSISPTMAEVIMDSEVGPEIAYYLAKNVEESQKIWRKSPAGQAFEIGKIEASILAKNAPAPKTPAATPKPAAPVPEPITPVSSSRSTPPKVSTSDPRSTKQYSPSEWIDRRNKEVQNRK